MPQEVAEPGNLQFLPEWIWQLRIRWASTLTYQTIRDGISDYLAPASSSWKIRQIRKRFNPDLKYMALIEARPEPVDVSTQNEGISTPAVASYQCLPSCDSIRLLHLLPGPEGSPIQTTLSVHSISSLPPYEALSYCWGRKSGVPISCNSHLISIQENLFFALSALRWRDSERILWADAICINQNDDKEKSTQVQLMRSIYECSTRVVVWLGQHAKSAQGVDLLTRIQQLALEDYGKMVGRDQALGPEDLRALGLPSVNSTEWRALDSLFGREWFTRVWIIQELVVSKDSLVICGNRSFSWTELARAAQFIFQHSLTAITQVDPRLPIKLEKLRQAHLTFNGDQPILPLLLETRNSFATRDRDKIFALMGLSGSETSGLVPDYSSASSDDKVFINFSKYHMEKTGALDILGAVEDHSHRLKKQLPSWVPDWEVHPPGLPLSLLEQYLEWDASKGFGDQALTIFTNHDKTLRVKGIAVDTVLHIGDSFLEYVPLPGTAQDWYPYLKTEAAKKLLHSATDFLMQQRYRQWERIAKRSKKYRGDEDVLPTFIKTVIADANLLSDGPISTSTSTVSSPIEKYYTAWCKYWNTASEQQGKYIFTSYNSTTPTELQMAVKFMQAHHKAAYGRRFFTSKSHDYMGLCPSLTRKGDVLVILFGGRTPFILRKQGRGQWKFIGECYTHGLMSGEFFRQGTSDGRDIRVTDFSLV
ncbi:HET-domain-containing protein [Lepidopterella palustris CBS 459.81]|uniref:HET-domain-containing protein n=1 Tax=Lepidopterella palustris CBS 459.81 TaxID=1314670 RepID=A0A8E2J8N0_9PEZI|nr:HET-domain-containing protein [Lepidopterella palustris CBS 459.81]